MNPCRFHPLAALLVALACCVCVAAARPDTLQEAQRLLAQGQYQQALDRTEQILTSKPKDAQARFLKGVAQTEQGQDAAAIATFQALVEDYPELPEPYNNLAVLRADNPGLYVILLDHDVTDGPRLNAGPAWLAEALPELVQQGTITGVKHLYVGHRHQDYRELVRNLPADRARECYLESEPEIQLTVWDRSSRLLLLKTGDIWSVPGITSSNGDLAAEDQKWLVHRLGGKPGVSPDGGAARRSGNPSASAAPP